MTAILFYIFAALLIASALFVVLNRSPVYSVVALVFSFANLAGIYFLLEAYFIGVLQILVYAGAIMVLFLFIVMLLDVQLDKSMRGIIHFHRWWFAILAGSFLVGFILLAGTGLRTLGRPGAADTSPAGAIGAIGEALFTEYLLPFEIASLLLTVALVGTVFLAKRRI